MARRMMLKRHYKVERKDVERFLRRHRDHLGVRAGLAWLEGWVYNNSDEHGTTTNQHVARLREAGVQPLAILNEIAAVWLYAARHPYLDDGRPLTYALASAVLHLTPLRRNNAKPDAPWSPRITYKDISGRNRREVGEAIRAALAVLLSNIARAIMEQRVEDKDQRAALRTAFPRDSVTGRFKRTSPPSTTEGAKDQRVGCPFPRDPVTGKFTKRTPPPTTKTEGT